MKQSLCVYHQCLSYNLQMIHSGQADFSRSTSFALVIQSLIFITNSVDMFSVSLCPFSGPMDYHSCGLKFLIDLQESVCKCSQTAETLCEHRSCSQSKHNSLPLLLITTGVSHTTFFHCQSIYTTPPEQILMLRDCSLKNEKSVFIYPLCMDFFHV